MFLFTRQPLQAVTDSFKDETIESSKNKLHEHPWKIFAQSLFVYVRFPQFWNHRAREAYIISVKKAAV